MEAMLLSQRNSERVTCYLIEILGKLKRGLVLHQVLRIPFVTSANNGITTKNQDPPFFLSFVLLMAFPANAFNPLTAEFEMVVFSAEFQCSSCCRGLV